MKLKKLFELMTSEPAQAPVDHNPKQDDHEASMAIADLKQLADQATQLAQKIQTGDELQGWIQAKITKASDYIEAVHKFYHYNPETAGGNTVNRVQENKKKK